METNEFKWLQQPKGSRICGQVAIAVLANISIEEAIKLIGKKGCTKTKDLITAVRKLGFECPNRCKKMPRPKLAIAQMHDSNKTSGWHWVLVVDNKIFDGVNGYADGQVHWPDSCKITSYLPLLRTRNGTAF